MFDISNLSVENLAVSHHIISELKDYGVETIGQAAMLPDFTLNLLDLSYNQRKTLKSRLYSFKDKSVIMHLVNAPECSSSDDSLDEQDDSQDITVIEYLNPYMSRNNYEVAFKTKNEIVNDIPIKDIALPSKIRHGLIIRGHYETLLDVLNSKVSTLKNIRNFGRASFDEIMTYLGSICVFHFGDKPLDIIDNEVKSVLSYISLLPDRDRSLLMDRLSGLSLSSIGQKYNLSRERVRQIILDVMDNRVDVFWEDRYLYWFEKYAFTKSEFCKLFGVADYVYYYLTCVGTLGSVNISKIEDDEQDYHDLIKKY